MPAPVYGRRCPVVGGGGASAANRRVGLLAWGCWRRATAARYARALIRRFAPPSPATQEKGCSSGVGRLRAGRRVGPQPLLDRGAIAGAQQGGRACAQLAQVAGSDGVGSEGRRVGEGGGSNCRSRWFAIL